MIPGQSLRVLRRSNLVSPTSVSPKITQTRKASTCVETSRDSKATIERLRKQLSTEAKRLPDTGMHDIFVGDTVYVVPKGSKEPHQARVEKLEDRKGNFTIRWHMQNHTQKVSRDEIQLPRKSKRRKANRQERPERASEVSPIHNNRKATPVSVTGDTKQEPLESRNMNTSPNKKRRRNDESGNGGCDSHNCDGNIVYGGPKRKLQEGGDMNSPPRKRRQRNNESGHDGCDSRSCCDDNLNVDKKRSPEQEEALLRALGLGSAPLYPEAGHIYPWTMQQFLNANEALSVYFERPRTTFRENKNDKSNSSSKKRRTHCRLRCELHSSCSFLVQSKERTDGNGNVCQEVVSYRPHSCSKEEHSHANLCSPEFFKFFLREEEFPTRAKLKSGSWKMASFIRYLNQKFGIDFSPKQRQKMIFDLIEQRNDNADRIGSDKIANNDIEGGDDGECSDHSPTTVISTPGVELRSASKAPLFSILTSSERRLVSEKKRSAATPNKSDTSVTDCRRSPRNSIPTNFFLNDSRLSAESESDEVESIDEEEESQGKCSRRWKRGRDTHLLEPLVHKFSACVRVRASVQSAQEFVGEATPLKNKGLEECGANDNSIYVDASLKLKKLRDRYKERVKKGQLEPCSFGWTLDSAKTSINSKLKEWEEQLDQLGDDENETEDLISERFELKKSMRELARYEDKERLVRMQEKKDDEDYFRRMAYNNRGRKKTDLYVETTAFCHRPIYFVSEKEWKKAKNHKCDLKGCQLCSKYGHVRIDDKTTHDGFFCKQILAPTPAFRKYDIYADDDNSDDEGNVELSSSSRSSGRRSSRKTIERKKIMLNIMALKEMQYSIDFIEEYSGLRSSCDDE